MTERAEPALIRFDRKTYAFLGALLLALALGTAFKLNGSSIAVWEQFTSHEKHGAGVLLGTPKFVRIDEWEVTTPAIVSQASSRPSFPVVNPNWGPGPVPLIENLPCRHWSMGLRPQFWGFFVFDVERGFAFYWNMKACLLLGGVFLLLMLLTENDFGVSLLGAAWAFFSGFTQWWYSSPVMMPETIGYVALLLVAAHYLALSERPRAIGIAAGAVALCLLNSILTLYPGFQVPLFYLAIAIAAGSLGPRWIAGRRSGARNVRIGAALAALAAVAFVLAAFYRDAKPAIDLVRGTVYPGARVSSGGELTVAQVFGGFYGFLMSMSNFPAAWSNACEASNFVLLSPVPLAVLAWRAWRKKGTTALEWSLAAYIAVVLAWLTLRWPYALAAATGFGWSSKTRPLLGLGLASVLLCCVYLSKRRDDLPAGLRGRILVAGSMLALLAAYVVDFSRVTEGFASPAQSILVSLAACGAGYLLLARKKTAFAIGLLLPSIWSFGLVNPVVQGLGPIIDTKLFKEVSAIVAKDPDARWAVFGRWAQIGSIRGDGIGYLKADFIKATGARVFNGTKVVPPLDDLRAIDPNSAAAWTYNRYAHVGLVPHDGPEVEFTQSAEDAYTISIDPVGSDFGKLGIRYVALPAAVANQEFRDATSLVLQLTDSWMWVYEYR